MQHLSISAMLLVCSYLLKEGRKILESKPLLKVFIPQLEELRELLAKSSIDNAPLSEEQKKTLRGQLGELDKRHDGTQWVLFHLLMILMRWQTNKKEVEKLETLQTALYPNNLKINLMSYTDEAGEAIRVARSIDQDKEKKDLLTSFGFFYGNQKVTGLQLLNQLANVGTEMEKALVTLHTKTSGPSSERVARLRFFKVMRALSNSAALAFDPDVVPDELFQALNEEVKKAKNPQPKTDEEPVSTDNQTSDTPTETPS